MKNILLTGLLFIAAASFASKTDSIFQRHQISVSMTNGVSAVLENSLPFGGYSSTATTPYYPFTHHLPYNTDDIVPHSISYIPNYSLHLRCEYSLGLSKLIRLETGIGYLLEGLTIHYNLTDNPVQKSTTYCYIGSLNVPLHIKFCKATNKGAFTCTFGPNVNMPLHQFYRTTDIRWDSQASSPPQNGHNTFNTGTTSQYAALGFDIKMAYEKKLNDRMAINMGPAIDFVNLIPFHRNKLVNTGPMPEILQSYIGFDVALNFSLKR